MSHDRGFGDDHEGATTETGTPLVADRGASKQAEPTDPLEAVAHVVPGDADLLARCFVEEYAFMGYDGAAILELFRDPRYLAVHAIYERRGEDAVRRLVDDVLAECGVMRVTVETAPTLETGDTCETVPTAAAARSADTAGGNASTRRRPGRLVQIEVPGDGRKESGR